MDEPRNPPAAGDARSAAIHPPGPARWQRLQELFETLLALPPCEREAALAAEADDDALKQEALALVDAAERTGESIVSRLDPGARDVVLPADRRLGAWRLIEEIGSGGMGTVFLAERTDDAFDQRVAIKLLRGIPTRESTERMRRERQILADLAHPHIARLLDGGSTPEGQPYLAMEYVDGEPLNTFCRKRNLPLAARLRLIAKICAAVQYAHQHLVIHRDLKPANVLVRADGEPVLLDFGIAKLLADTGAPVEPTGKPWFTPAYASPEQRAGRAVSTATDIYGLGLLLCEIVTGRAPDGDAQPQLPKPGGRSGIAGDLVLIVAKATQAEPERRYVSAAALAEDLERHLNGRPVLAAPDRLLYRLRKQVLRHRVATVALVAILASSIAFVGQLARERDRALRAEALSQRQSVATQEAIDYLVALFRSASPDHGGDRPISPRDLVDRGRREIEARLDEAPEQQARLLATLGRLYTELGLMQQAIDTLGKAIELAGLYGGTPRQRAGYLADQGFAMILADRTDLAESTLRDALAALGDTAAKERRLAAEILSTLAIAQARNGDPAAAEAHARRALDYAGALTGQERVTYARCVYALSEVYMRLNRLDDAEREAERSIALMQSLLPDDAPDVLNAKGILLMVYEQQGRYADGERVLRRLLDTRLRSLDPASLWIITTRINLAQAIQLQGRLVEATAVMRETLELLRTSGQQESRSYAIALNNLASALEQAGDVAGATPMFREALVLAKRQSDDGDDPSVRLYRLNLGLNLIKNGKLDEALPLIEPDIEGGPESREFNIDRGRRLSLLAEWMRRSRRFEEALDYIEQARTLFGTIHPARHQRFGYLARARGVILRDQKRLAEAETELRYAAEILPERIGRDSNNTIETELDLAEVLLERGKVDEARALHRRMAPLLAERFVPHSAVRTRHAEMTRRLAGVAAH
ncbi:serine/threonine-protein kinase [Dokdonella sp.]|uniref:serine/threonine-protein kinase n=1 Tax=Dokdonella sp. TaxID=2291710 RepID=UPI0026246805|nr:serine/threonine-protein kinase [Dokdonella sp.]